MIDDRGGGYGSKDGKIKALWGPRAGAGAPANRAEFLARDDDGPRGIGNITRPGKDAVSPRAAAIETLIDQIDKALDTDNFVPIYEVRERLGRTMSRQDVDRALFELQAADRISMSTLQDVSLYTAKQIDAGIPQDIGGAWFYLSIED